MEFCRLHTCPMGDCEYHPCHAPRGFAYTSRDMDVGCKRLADYQAEEAAKADRIQKMSMGTAYVIFQNIDNPDISTEEKAAAIFKIINMETHNSVTKASMLKALRWLLELSFDIEEG